MTKIRGVILAMCLMALSMIAVAACGGDDDDASDGNGAEATVTAAPDDGATPDGEATAPADEEPAEGDDDDGSDDVSGAAVEDPCKLLTQSEVEAALGASVQVPVVTYTGNANVSGTVPATVGTCAYVSPLGIPSANLTVWSAPGESEAIDDMIELACTGKETISGLGDLACWYDDGHAEVQVGSGGFFLDIFVTMEGDASVALLDLSEKSVASLP